MSWNLVTSAFAVLLVAWVSGRLLGVRLTPLRATIERDVAGRRHRAREGSPHDRRGGAAAAAKPAASRSTVLILRVIVAVVREGHG
jgi:hypothetical protein